MMIIPPKEIAKYVRFDHGTIYCVGELNDKEKSIFNEFKKQVEKIPLKRSKV